MYTQIRAVNYDRLIKKRNAYLKNRFYVKIASHSRSQQETTHNICDISLGKSIHKTFKNIIRCLINMFYLVWFENTEYSFA